MQYRFGLFDVTIGAAAALTTVLLSVVLERAGLAQPFALAIAVPCGLLVFYPVMRRWSRAKLSFLSWVMASVLIGVAGLLFQLLFARF